MKSKEKVQKIRQHRNRTGGGSPCGIVLSEFDERVLAIIGDHVADGDPALKEIGFADSNDGNSCSTMCFNVASDYTISFTFSMQLLYQKPMP